MTWLISPVDSANGAQMQVDSGQVAARWDYDPSINAVSLAAGSLVADGVAKTSSLLILDVSTGAEAEAPVFADPATQAQTGNRVEIRFWNPANWNGCV